MNTGDKPIDSKSIDLAEQLKEKLFGVKSEMKELNAMSKLYNASLGISNKNLVQQSDFTAQLNAKLAQKVVGSNKYLALQNLTKQAEEGMNDIASERNRLQSDLLLKQVMVATNLKGSYAEQAKTYTLLLKSKSISTEEYQLAIARLKADQKHTDHLSHQIEMQEEVARKILEIKEETEEWKHSLTKVWETAKAIGRDPKVFGAFMLTQMVGKLEKIHHQFEELGTSGLTVGQRIDSMSKGFSIMSMIGLSDTKGVLDGMVESMGSMNSLTSAEVDHVGHLAKEMGVTGQEAFGLVEGFSKLPGETMKTATHAADYVKTLSKANGVAPGKITKEIAKNTELMALGGYKSAKAFTEAAMKAQKMGVELSTSKNVMNGLLNFEDSINKQMEASVLLGREINLDKARGLALEGKAVEATQEVLKNIGGQAEFEKMNVLQKQALAAATGMTVEELSKAVDAQEEFNKYHGEDVAKWKEGLGYAMEYGGATLGFLKENATAILSSVQMLGMLGNTRMVGWMKEKAIAAWRFMTGNKELAQSQAKIAAIEAEALAEKTKSGGALVPSGGVKNMAPMAKGGKGLGGLAGGLSKMGTGKVALGALNLMLFGVAGVVALAALPFLLFMSIPAVGIGLRISFMALAGGLQALANPAVMLGVGVLSLLVLSVGAGMMMLGVGIGVAAEGMSLLVTSLKDVPFENLMMLPIAFMGMAVGIGAFALAGLAALPIIGGLIALAAVAPGLASLAGVMNGGGKGSKDSKEDAVVKELRELKALIQKGGTVIMDGKKVGDVVALAIGAKG
jgi:hypothetical protein